MRRLPPLNPLRMFEAAARHQNFARAAKELGVTQAAVSRQIRVLEDYLAVRLFEREHSTVCLTRAGAQYFQSIHQAVELIAESTEDIVSGVGEGSLVIQSYTTFALRWLIPRLPAFNQLYPNLQINLITSVARADFDRDQIDAAIQFGPPAWSGVVADELMRDVICPVCSPALLRQGPPLNQPTDFADHTLLYAYHRRGDWRHWLSAAGVSNLKPAKRLTFESSSLVYQAAIEGLGVGMAQPAFIEAELADGRLVAPFGLRVERPLAYYLLRPKKLRQQPKVTAFRNWLVEQAAISAMRLQPRLPQAS